MWTGNETSRTVLPLALVHRRKGVKLLAWCEEREGFRQFFVRAMEGLAARPGDFSDRRMTLLQGLVEKPGGRDGAGGAVKALRHRFAQGIARSPSGIFANRSCRVAAPAYRRRAMQGPGADSRRAQIA